MAEKIYTLPKNSGYQIIRRLGSGGEGTVYLVCHLCTEQLRAAKILTNIREDRMHELDMMKHLNHPSLPKIIDVIEHDGFLWLIMEYIQGCRLDQRVSQGMTCELLWTVAEQLSQVLVYLHTRKEPIIHLDIKPSNILIRPDQTLVLIDFGASIRGHPLEERAGKYGTRGFAAPEQQLSGKTVDARADIYGAGAVLYYCCFGCAPDIGQNFDYRTRPNFPYGMLGCIIKKCLQEDPENRFGDSRQFYKAICRAKRSELLFRKSTRIVGVMALLLSVTLLFFYCLCGNYLLEEANYQEKTLAYESALSSDTGQHKSGNQKNNSDNIPEKEAESNLENALEGDRENDSEQGTEVTETETEKTETEEGKVSEAETEENIQEYRRLLNMAGGMGLSMALECFQQASALYPGDSEWYMRLLEYVTVDGLYEAEEENAVKELIYATGADNGNTALEFLASNTEAYGLFTYRMGLTYWYYYDGTGGKSAAAWWFQQAIASQDENQNVDWYGNAVILSRIGSYYGMLGSTSTEEEREAKEWDYWNDLIELWYLYQAQEEKTEIRAQTAEELLSLLVLKSGIIRQYGAAWEDTTGVLASIDEFLEGEFMADDLKEREKLAEQNVAARAALERAYQE
ncbi:MAG: serine/threonine protein kinase [Lachnospiraceae bacterium]|nr:serine/threonine protein kinase [Lachnospiraceae bacterium]